MNSSAAISLFAAPVEMSLNTSTSRSDKAGPRRWVLCGLAYPFQQPGRYTGLNRGLASVHCSDGSEDLSWGRVLEQVGSGGTQNIPTSGLTVSRLTPTTSVLEALSQLLP